MDNLGALTGIVPSARGIGLRVQNQRRLGERQVRSRLFHQGPTEAWNTFAMPRALATIALALPCSLAVLKARSRSRPTRSLDRSIECCCRAIDSAWSSRTRSRIGLTRLNNLEA